MNNHEMIDARSLHQRVYDVLIERVISGDLSAGDRLDASELAQALGVSRTPVKEALSRLASEGIVAIQARRGTSVKVPTHEEVIELYDVMRMIGLYVADASIRNGGATAIGDLEQLLLEIEGQVNGDAIQDYAKYLEKDRAFHTYVVQLAGNGRLLDMYRVAGLQIRLAYTPDSLRIHDVKSAARQHRSIIEAFRIRSAPSLREATRQHYRFPPLLDVLNGDREAQA